MADLIFRRACPFPVGSVLIMYDTTNPQTLYPGTTWVATCQGRFPIGEGSVLANTLSTYGNVSANEYAVGNRHERGGERLHTLSAAEMPKHTHALWCGYGEASSSGYDTLRYQQTWGTSNRGYNTSILGVNPIIQYAGSGSAHNNLPPYEAFWFWRRSK